MLQQGGEQTARPDETSFYLTFLYAKTAAAAVLALPHVSPPDATTSQDLALKGSNLPGHSNAESQQVAHLPLQPHWQCLDSDNA